MVVEERAPLEKEAPLTGVMAPGLTFAAPPVKSAWRVVLALAATVV